MQQTRTETKSAKWVALFCLGLIAPLFFLPAFTPDELWFHRDAVAIANSGINPFSQLPHLGYGASFWLLYATLVKLAPDKTTAMLVARMVCFLVAASIPFLLIWHGDKIRSPFTLQGVLLWFSMPMAWWCGKVVSPEIPSYALAVFAAASIGEHPLFAWSLWGAAVGLKLTALPIGLFLLFLGKDLTRDGIRKAIRYSAFGFVLMNPAVVFHPVLFGHEMIASGLPFRFDLENFKRVLISTSWEWDGIPSGGFFVHGVCLLSVVLVLGLLLAEGKNNAGQRTLAIGFLSAMALTLTLAMRSIFHLWYAFPILALVPFCLTHLNLNRQWVRTAVVAQFLFGAPLIYLQYTNKLADYFELTRYEAAKSEVEASLTNWQPNFVADLLTCARIPIVPTVHGVQYLDDNASQTVVTDGPGKQLMGRSGKIAIVLNKRLLNLSDSYDPFRNGLSNPKWLGQFRLIATKQTTTAILFLFESN